MHVRYGVGERGRGEATGNPPRSFLLLISNIMVTLDALLCTSNKLSTMCILHTQGR